MFVSIVSFSVLTPRSTNPVGVCIYGVPYMSLIWWFLQNSLKVRPVNAVASSVLLVFGMPFRFVFCSINLTVVSPSVDLQRLAAGYLLNRSIESKMKKPLVFSVNGPIKSSCTFSFGLFNAGNCFFPYYVS